MFKAAWQHIKKWLTGWLKGGPHFIVGPHDNPYLHRWYLLPRNPILNIYLHRFLRDDEDRARHDHPWPSVSILLRGRYVEETPKGKRLFCAGSVVLRRSTHTHRIELPEGKHAWTLFITGPRLREWGFHCPRGWVHWREFTAPTNYGQTGKGCD